MTVTRNMALPGLPYTNAEFSTSPAYQNQLGKFKKKNTGVGNSVTIQFSKYQF